MAHTRSDGKGRLSLLDKLHTAVVELEGQITDAEDRTKRNAPAREGKERAMATRFPAMRRPV